EDMTFQFRFRNDLAGGDGIKLNIGGKNVAVPLFNVGAITAADTSKLNVLETYQVKLMRGNRRGDRAMDVTNAAGGAATFKKPADYIGTKSEPDYAAYAAAHVYN